MIAIQYRFAIETIGKEHIDLLAVGNDVIARAFVDDSTVVAIAARLLVIAAFGILWRDR